MNTTFDTVISESPAWALLVVFWIGAVTSLTACMVVRLPVIMGCVAGSGSSKKRGLILTFLFCVGLVLSYVTLGAITAFADGVIHKILVVNRYIFWSLGIILFVAGVWVSGLLSLRPASDQSERIKNRWLKAGPIGAFLLGVLFGLLVMPACPCCRGGLLVLAGIVEAKNLSYFALLVFASFGLGQSLPVFSVGLLTSLFKAGLIRRLRTRMCSIEQRIQLLAGNVLMVLGVYLVVVG
jgi:cytochrome c-type biogenesis protein